MEFEFLSRRLKKEEARLLNPLVLAFLGDAVFELVIRDNLVKENNQLSAHKLHLKAISYVKAHAQSEFVKNIMNKLTEEEMSIYKRGRNTKSATVPKNADVQEYRAATGLEALVGFLYITGQDIRLKELLANIII